MRELTRLCVFAFFVVAASALVHAQPLDVPAAGQPGSQTIQAAVERVKGDPNLSTDRKVRRLRWRDSNSQRRSMTLPQWILELIRAAEEWSRLLVWGVVLLAAVVLAAYLVRVARSREPRSGEVLSVLPSHVREMDIRPESLPRDIGAAARALWDLGEHRAALALLDRGALSRLVHVHRVPIRDSSTEGDCLRLAVRALTPSAGAYVSGLIGVWQRSVYGHQLPESSRVQQLCDGFDVALSRDVWVDPSQRASS